jgi:PAS domain S-box-containing protein
MMSDQSPPTGARDGVDRFQEMADAAPAILWATDTVHQCTFLSRGWYEYTGQSEGAGLDLGWTQAAHPDDQARTRQAFLDAAARREPFRAEYRLQTGDGQYRWAIDQGRPRFGAGGEFLGYVGSVLDIHDRKRSEQRLQQAHALLEGITQGTDDLIAAADGSCHVQYCNAAYRADFVSLWDKQIEIGASFVDLLGDWPEQQQQAIGLWRRALAGESFSVTIGLGPSADRRQVYEARFSPIYNEHGKISAAAHILRNVTERVQSTEALRQARDELEQRVAERTAELQLQTERLRNLAHELVAAEHRERKRLAALLHDDLQQLLVAAKIRLTAATRNVHDVESASALERVLEIVDSAVDASRHLTRQLRPPVLYEAGLVPALQWLATDMNQVHGLDIETDMAELSVPLSDELKALLFESVRELLRNVVKHAGVRAARMCLRHHEPYVEVAVEDRGSGFDAHQLEDAPARHELGLFSIRERLAALGGALRLQGLPGGGTRVELAIPIAADGGVHVRQHLGLECTSADPIAALGEHERPTRVLVVDDHAIVRQGIANVLRGDERMVVVGEASDGVDAIAAVAREHPDVVLMDVNMPRMNGVEATREIRARWPAVRVVALSVQDDAATAQTMRNAGAEAFISKSDDASLMIRTVLGDAVLA